MSTGSPPAAGSKRPMWNACSTATRSSVSPSTGVAMTWMMLVP